MLAEYGREDGFVIVINSKSLDVDDLQGQYSAERVKFNGGEVRLRCTVRQRP